MVENGVELLLLVKVIQTHYEGHCMYMYYLSIGVL